LEAFFMPGEEIVIARSRDDVLATILKPDEDRNLVAAAGRAKCLAAHTAGHRAAALETALLF
jgi:spore maturation protein CgeB